MLDEKKIPAHVAVVMDGNGRWAARRGLPRLAGHNAGMLAMKEIIKRAAGIGVRYLTVYAFSTENWKRSAEEVGGIFRLLVRYVDSELKELHKNNVKVKILGDLAPLPSDARNRIEKAVSVTGANTGLQLNIALNYGSRDEILRAVRALAKKAEEEPGFWETIDEACFSRRLFTGEDFACVPDPDLVIRTSGEQRLSNFLLWQSAYSEFMVSDLLWPDFTPEAFERAIEEYQGRERRFGGRIRKEDEKK